MDTDRIPEPVRRDAVNRLRRAEGQIRALTDALERGTDCERLVTQLTAAHRAVERAGVRLLIGGLAACLADERDGDLAPERFERLLVNLT